MSLLSDAEISQMRTVAAEALPASGTIYTQTWTSDGGGGGSITWAASGTANCRIGPISGAERESGDRISSDADFIVTFPGDTSITTDSRVVSGGGTYAVAAIRDRSWDLTTRVETVKETS